MGLMQNGSMQLEPAHGPDILGGSMVPDEGDCRRVGFTEQRRERSKSVSIM